MKRAALVLAAILCLFLPYSSLWAAPTTAGDAETVVQGWLQLDPQPLGASLGQEVSRVQTFTNDQGDIIYYVVYLRPAGFVVVSADDLVEPIIAFAAEGMYDPAPESPLGALVTGDLNPRVQAARETPVASALSLQAASKTQQKWGDLLSRAQKPMGKIEALSAPPICTGGPSDIRVAPFTETRWGQGNVKGGTLPCYNFYTPQADDTGYVRWGPDNGKEKSSNNYPCGCVAAAMAQLMYYYKHPATDVGIEVCDVNVVIGTVAGFEVCAQISRSMRGGDGSGGPYRWDDMVLTPGPNTSEEARRAIGALCYDAGLSVGMTYGPDGSSTTTSGAAGLKGVFQYANAVEGSNDNSDIGAGLIEMVNPNLDARNPVILGIIGPDGGHAAVADGYGYDSAGTPYHHLNMGFRGTDDCWYNLPQFSCPVLKYKFDTVLKCSYNIFPETAGEIISGRVRDNAGSPISGVTVATTIDLGNGGHWEGNVWVESEFPQIVALSDTTDAKGIYALVGVPAGQTCTIRAEKTGYDFAERTVTVGLSADGEPNSGNRWGVDLVGSRADGTNANPAGFRLLGAAIGSLFELQINPAAEVPLGGYFPHFFSSFDSSPNGVLYGLRMATIGTGSNHTWNSSLYTIDPTTAAVKFLGNIRTATQSTLGMESITFAPNGTLYGYCLDDQNLYTIDYQFASSSTGIYATKIAKVTGGFVTAIEFSDDGTLYGAYDSLYTIDPKTAQVNSESAGLSFNTAQDLDFAADGGLYVIEYWLDPPSRLYRVDRQMTTSTLIGTYESSITAIASQTLP